MFEARWSEVEWMIQKNIHKEGAEIPEQQGEFEATDDNVVRLRGLPFEAGRAEIIRFFEGTYLLILFKTKNMYEK